MVVLTTKTQIKLQKNAVYKNNYIYILYILGSTPPPPAVDIIFFLRHPLGFEVARGQNHWICLHF